MGAPRPYLRTAHYRRFRKSILNRDGWRCHHCGTVLFDGVPGSGLRGNAELDHLTSPRMGTTPYEIGQLERDPLNAVASCRSCNRKRARGQEVEIRATMTAPRHPLVARSSYTERPSRERDPAAIFPARPDLSPKEQLRRLNGTLIAQAMAKPGPGFAMHKHRDGTGAWDWQMVGTQRRGLETLDYCPADCPAPWPAAYQVRDDR